VKTPNLSIRARPLSIRVLGCLLVAAAVLSCLGGCVRRRMTIRSNPPGAVVYIDNREIGATPVATDFTYYGTRNIRLVKDGCETLTVEQPIPSPWYQIPPLDFISENLVPAKIHDHRTLNYQLTPQRMVPPDELRGRAEDLRGRAGATGMFAAGPPGAPPGAVGVPAPPGPPIVPPARAPALAPPPPGSAPAPLVQPPGQGPRMQPPGNGTDFQTLPYGGRAAR